MSTYSEIRGSYSLGALLSLSLIVGGCSMFSGEAKLHKTDKGSVYLKEIADWSFEASHPATIDQLTMLKVIKGVVTDDSTKTTANLPASGSKPMRVFSDEDAEFLAPLLAQGLLQAKPEQMVGFKVSSSAGSGTEPTAGTLYVYRGSIYLTIGSQQGKKVWGFMPSSIARVEKAAPFIPLGSGAMTLVIDQQAVAKAPMPSTTTVASSQKPGSSSTLSPAPSMTAQVPSQASQGIKTASRQDDVLAPTQSPEGDRLLDPTFSELASDDLLNKKMDELREAREINKIKDSEISMLKKEVTWMKQELRERSAEISSLKGDKVSNRSPLKKKKAQAYPTH